MREIKFRAWHKINKKILTIEVLPLVNGNSPVSPVWHSESIKNSKHSSLKYLELMQSTGLKDKNGKGQEVYEDDIVEFFSEDDGKIIGIVKFLEAGFCIVDKNGEYEENLWSAVYNCSLKIIGNIWENPELLKEIK